MSSQATVVAPDKDASSEDVALDERTTEERVTTEQREEFYDRTPNIDRAMWARLRIEDIARKVCGELKGDAETVEIVKLWEDRDWYKAKYEEYRKKCASLRKRYELVVDRHNYLVTVSRNLRDRLETIEDEMVVEEILTVDKEDLKPVQDLCACSRASRRALTPRRKNLGPAPFYVYLPNAGYVPRIPVARISR